METEKKYALLIDADNVSPKFVDYRNRLMSLLGQENSLIGSS